LASQANYSYCSENKIDKLRLVVDIREHAKFVCESYNSARGMMDYADLFRFDSRGSYQEASSEAPGDIIPKKMLRFLVATPMKASDFVSVMPGVYRMAGESGHSDFRATTAALTENYPNLARSFGNSQNQGEQDDTDLETSVGTTADAGRTIVAATANSTCGAAVLWRTEKRSYCTQDAAEECSEMSLDLRFRK